MRVLFAFFIACFLLVGCTDYPSPHPDNYLTVPPQTNFDSASLNSSVSADSASDLPIRMLSLQNYTLSQVALHNIPSDCWVVVNNSVLNFSNSQFEDFAGINLSSFCGTDASSHLSSILFGRGNWPQSDFATRKLALPDGSPKSNPARRGGNGSFEGNQSSIPPQKNQYRINEVVIGFLVQ